VVVGAINKSTHGYFNKEKREMALIGGLVLLYISIQVTKCFVEIVADIVSIFIPKIKW
jgi:hypothetical protein